MTEPEYDAAKFEELLLYVTERTQDDPACGDMKLNKLLYYADFLAFEKLGHAISGVPYQRLPWGPAPRYLLPVREKMKKRGEIKRESRDYHGYVQTVTLPGDRTADRSAFSPEELKLIDEVINRFRDRNGTEMSDLSHHEPGWKLVDEGQDIPYEASLLARRKPPAGILDRAQQLAKSKGW